MKQEYKDKFELKIKLNKAIDSGKIDKNNFDWIIKNILKSNLFLKKHFSLVKLYLEDLYTECNDLLEYQFFINDKILITWIARGLNQIIRKDNSISMVLKYYLDVKHNSLKENFHNDKYRRKLWERTLISCDDDCFKNYLPLDKCDSNRYWEYGEEKKNLYPQFDNELEKGLYNYKLNNEEVNNIMEFYFNSDILEMDIENEIKRYIQEYVDNKEKYSEWVEYNINLYSCVFRWIREFENIEIHINNKYSFENMAKMGKIYELLKNGNFNYNVNDKYFIIDKDDDGKIIEIISINQFKEYVDLSMWRKYMCSHDIDDLTEMYITK